jgi:hypothetical protein
MNRSTIALLRIVGWSLVVAGASAYLFFYSAQYFLTREIESASGMPATATPAENCHCQPNQQHPNQHPHLPVSNLT